MALDQLLHPTLDPDAPRDVLTTRTSCVSRRGGSGKIVLDADTAEQCGPTRGEKVILVPRGNQPGRHPWNARRHRVS